MVIEEDFDGGGGESHLDLLFDQLIRDAVVMAIDLNMIVDIDPSLFPFGKLIGRIGERFQGGLVQGFEEVLRVVEALNFQWFKKLRDPYHSLNRPTSFLLVMSNP